MHAIRAVFVAAVVFALSACGQRVEEPPPANVKADPPPQPAPQPAPKPKPKRTSGNGTNLGVDPFSGLLGGGNTATPEEAKQLVQKFKTALVGTWTADLGNGATEELTYTADGTYTAKLTGPAPASASGTYTVLQLIGTKGLKIQLDDGTTKRTITANFDGAELEHPSLQKGVTGTFRKK